jgi:hypothetical protein
VDIVVVDQVTVMPTFTVMRCGEDEVVDLHPSCPQPAPTRQEGGRRHEHRDRSAVAAQMFAIVVMVRISRLSLAACRRSRAAVAPRLKVTSVTPRSERSCRRRLSSAPVRVPRQPLREGGRHGGVKVTLPSTFMIWWMAVEHRHRPGSKG